MLSHPSEIQWQDTPLPRAEDYSEHARVIVWLEYQLPCLYADVGKLSKITTAKTLRDKVWHEVDTLTIIKSHHIKFWAWVENVPINS